MIDVYTVVKWGFGDPISKQKALKITSKTVTFKDGRRENIHGDHRAHFATLNQAVEYYDLLHKQKLKYVQRQLEKELQAKSFFDAFVAAERGEE